VPLLDPALVASSWNAAILSNRRDGTAVNHILGPGMAEALSEARKATFHYYFVNAQAIVPLEFGCSKNGSNQRWLLAARSVLAARSFTAVTRSSTLRA